MMIAAMQTDTLNIKIMQDPPFQGNVYVTFYQTRNYMYIDASCTYQIKDNKLITKLDNDYRYYYKIYSDVDTVHNTLVASTFLHTYSTPFTIDKLKELFPKTISPEEINTKSTKLKLKCSLHSDLKNNIKAFVCTDEPYYFEQDYQGKLVENNFEIRAHKGVCIFVFPLDTDFVPGYWTRDAPINDWWYNSSYVLEYEKENGLQIQMLPLKKIGGKYTYTGYFNHALSIIKGGIEGGIQDDKSSIPMGFIYAFDTTGAVVAYAVPCDNKGKFILKGLAPGKYRIKPRLERFKTDERIISITDSDMVDQEYYMGWCGISDDPQEALPSVVDMYNAEFLDTNSRFHVGDTVTVRAKVYARSDKGSIKPLSITIFDYFKSAKYGKFFRGALTPINQKSWDGTVLSVSNYEKEDSCRVYYAKFRVDSLVATELTLISKIIEADNTYSSGSELRLFLSNDSTYLINPSAHVSVREEERLRLSPALNPVPNPVTPGELLHLSLNRSFDADAVAEIYSYAGICIRRLPLRIIAGDSEKISIPTDELLPGVYYIIIRISGEALKSKFVVR